MEQDNPPGGSVRGWCVWAVMCVGALVLIATSEAVEKPWSISGDTILTFDEGEDVRVVTVQVGEEAVAGVREATLVAALLRDVFAETAEAEGWAIALDEQNPQDPTWSIKNSGAVGLVTWDNTALVCEGGVCARTLTVSRVDDSERVEVQLDVLLGGEREGDDQGALTLTVAAP